MKKLIVILSLFFSLFPLLTAQIHIDIRGKVRDEIEDRANEKVDEAINESFDITEESVESVFEKDEEEETDKEENISTSDNDEGSEESDSGKGKSDDKKEQPRLVWAKYDFVPGDNVFFEDNHENEQNGEFPSRWDLYYGGGIENAVFDNHKVIYFREGDSYIIPFIEEPQKDYLPDVFTVEFDAWFEADEYCYYTVYFYDKKNQEENCNSLEISANYVEYEDIGGSGYPGEEEGSNFENSFWRHIAISFNIRALKVYLDDARLINIPNLGCNPTGITLGVLEYNTAGTKGINRFMKNIRIAEGGVKLYDRLLADGKIVSNGIKFDVNKATIKPESMGVINTICQLMKEHPELKFSVEGHTDSDGDDASNQSLSESRSKAVVDQLVSMGIESSRLSSKGWGESKPVAPNNTSEGKAMNRRVEFVKL